ncbi:hypothetical protein J3E71DRAFT_345650 [Bipolaris maydis]|nr:hypothetical protein J3E73DRAFT_372385 [Bipolaris maydis]KAJ6278575.1 hypothetical protein J3E71DRAFT_345650 [Bipolaris maydis]
MPTAELKTIWQEGKPLFVACHLGQHGEDAVPLGGATACLDTRIRLAYHLAVETYWAVKRQRARLQYLVQILKEHADDQGKGSLLQHLTLDFRLTRIPGPRLLPLP